MGDANLFNMFQELQDRGLVYQKTSEELKGSLDKGLSFYCGFDPSSDSLHIGSLLPLITMRRLQMSGSKPIVVVGGATGMIGDPSGKSQERQLLTNDVIEKNIQGIKKIIEKFLDFKGPHAAIVVNNASWMEKFSFIGFLRDVGKHFSVNYMIAKDSVKARLENRDQGISFTEFSYMLLQAYDYYFLNKEHSCSLQIGGSDQWGNITAGVELIRRMKSLKDEEKDSTYGLTFPLVTKSDGNKFGKTESGNVWLNADKTSIYQFYQFFLRVSDEDVIKFLKYFSFKSLAEIQKLEDLVKSQPEKREAQKELARELTVLVHGEAEFLRVQKASEALFSGDVKGLDKNTLLEVFGEAPSYKLNREALLGLELVQLLVDAKVCTSKGNARKDVASGGIYINGERIPDEAYKISEKDLLHGSALVLRKGKKNYCLVLV